VKRIYRVEPHPAASWPRGKVNAQPGAEIDAVRDGVTDACVRSMVVGNLSQWRWRPRVLLLSNTQTTVYNATHMLWLLTIQVVTQTHFTTFANYTCGLSLGTNILPVFWPKIYACDLSMSAAYSQDFTASDTSQPVKASWANNSNMLVLREVR